MINCKVKVLVCKAGGNDRTVSQLQLSAKTVCLGTKEEFLFHRLPVYIAGN